MRNYYIKGLQEDEDSFKYLKVMFNEYEDKYLEFIIGDINDYDYEIKLKIDELLAFSENNKIRGYRRVVRDEYNMIELVKYLPEFKEFEQHIVCYDLTNLTVDRGRAFKGMAIDAERFRYKYFDIKRTYVGLDEKLPVSIADYIINYAESDDFSPDLKYVYCHTGLSGVVRFTLKDDCKSLLAKLRLLR